LVAILLIPLLAMMAFAIDTGYMCLARTELQNAADAAALAGAEAMQPYYVYYNLPGQASQSQVILDAQAAAKAAAKKIAVANTAAGVNVQLLDADITFGFLDGSGNYTTPAPGFPNTVAVTARRDGTQNGSVSLFFGGVLGTSSVGLQAPARATIYVGDMTGLQNTSIRAAGLPVALDVNIWQAFYKTGQSPDSHKYSGPNGAYQLQVYPVPKQSPGNFSLVDLGPPVTDTPDFRNWIENGMSPSDIQYLISTGQVPVSLSAPQLWTVGPGLTDTLTSNFADVVNVPNFIPLFQPVSTNPYQAAGLSGSNSLFSVVGFASIIVSQVSGNGSNLNLSIQPAAVADAAMVIPNPKPAGTQDSTFGTSLTTFAAPKLTF
jgi:Flp pilus assembly protein TadG